MAVSEQNYYVFDSNKLLDISVMLDEIQKNLVESYSCLSSVFNSLNGESIWSGESKEAFMAYLDLLLQYHKAVSGTTENDDNSVVYSLKKNIDELIHTIEGSYSFSNVLNNLIN